MTIPSIVARSISKTYRRGRQLITALQNVAFEVSQGELVLLIGPSGSGKTTLLNLIAALDRPDSGEILIDGLDVTGLSRSAAAGYRDERVGMIFQSYNFAPAADRSRKHSAANDSEAATEPPARPGAARNSRPG